jgi:hypothetical protein
MRLIKQTGAMILAFATSLAVAQDYRLDWHSIDGGGGTSAGGAFQLSGTIGQPEATLGPLTGGSYALEGGFWVGWLLSAAGDLPALQIELVAGGIILSWPAAATGFTLEEFDIQSPEWRHSEA